MSVFQPDADRRLLPRWLPSTTAIEGGELASQSALTSKPPDDLHFEARKQEWALARSLDVAAELVGSGIVLGRCNEVEGAARQILSSNSRVSKSLREMAAIALEGRPRAQRPRSTPSRRQIDKPSIYQAISRIRHRLHQQPRNTFNWVDLARFYAVLGQVSQAEKAIGNALSLNPNDRFALRSGARFFVHVDDPERALALLRRASATRVDPWLMATEIAVSQVMRRTPKMLSLATRSLGSGSWSSHSQSELRGSVATSLLYDGSVVKARRLFQQSLGDPTENAVAQAQWATTRAPGLVIPIQVLQLPHNFETNVLRGRATGNWNSVLEDCWGWADYEPTSSRPMMFGSYVASVIFGDSDAMLEFARRGALAEPRNSMIRNNEVVALAQLGRIEEAWSIFRAIAIERHASTDRAVLLATMGLLHFRSGDVIAGRGFYQSSVDQPSARGNAYLRALALWHLAQEEVLANTAEITSAVVRAEEASRTGMPPEVKVLGDRIKQLARSRVAR